MALGACSDDSITTQRAAAAPPVVGSQYGMVRGTVREDGTLVLESLDPSIQAGDTMRALRSTEIRT